MMTSTTAQQATNHATKDFWQTQLIEHCNASGINSPAFNLMSDRRGCRTAWTSTVTVGYRTIQARNWYDGDHVDNAKEDAAEWALIQLRARS